MINLEESCFAGQSFLLFVLNYEILRNNQNLTLLNSIDKWLKSSKRSISTACF